MATTTMRTTTRTRDLFNALAQKRGITAVTLLETLAEREAEREDLRSCVVPATTTPGRSLHVPVVIPHQPPPSRKAYLMPEQVRTLSHERLVKRLSEPVPDACSEVTKRMRILPSDD